MNDAAKMFYENLPEIYRKRVEEEAKYAALGDTYRIVTSFMAASFFAVLLFSALLPFSLLLRAVIFTVSAIVVPPILPYLVISVAAENRKDEMEKVLPDALLLVSANLKSGVSIEKAFLLSARDEFGPLSEELRTSAMEMFGGKPVEETLSDMQGRVKSELFRETLKLLVDGIKSGGNTAKLLESSADDIRNSLEIQEEINANIRMYVIFILMAAVVGAPLLFSISVYMSETTAGMWQDVNLESMGDVSGNTLGSMSFSKPQIDTAFFEQFAIMSIIAINFFAGLIISEIKNANIKEGAKYIPVLIAISVTLFILILSSIGGLVGGFV